MTHSALVVGAAPEADPALVAELARAAALVVAADAGADVCLEAGVTPDVLVGDMDSVHPKSAAAISAAGGSVYPYSAAKDDTDLQLALATVRERGFSRVVVTGVTGGRLDHTLAAMGALAEAADLWPELRERSTSGWVLDRDGRHRVDLPSLVRAVSVVALGGPARARSDGLRWSLDDVGLLPLSGRGVSNETVGPAWIEVADGVLAVLVCDTA